MLKKFLIGTFALAIILGGAIALVPKVVKAAPQAIITVSDIQYAATVRLGNSGQAALIWQRFLNGYSTTAQLVEDGAFGPLTAAQAKAWQASRGLVADGIMGPMSRASAIAQIQSGAPASAFPAGCTSTVGYSSVTGLPCSTVSTLPAGCTSTAGYSPTTGASCAGTVTTLPAGCTSTAGYSPTTGASCSGGTTPTGPLVGGAGDITAVELSTPSASTKVGEGDVATKVYGVEYEADSNSDLEITSVKITLINGGSGSKKLDRYAKNVSVWYNDVKVGSANASEFSESSDTYTKSIPLSGVVVRAGEKGKLYFAVDAIADIDSGNVSVTYNTWTITVSSTRYIDASGVVTTDSTASLANTFIFDTLSSTQDVELKVNLSSSTPSSTTVKLSATTDTAQVELMRFTMKAQGSSMYIDQIPVLFTSSEASFSLTSGNVTLVIDGKTFNETVPAAGGAAVNILFDKLGLNLAADQTITGIVYADMNDIETTDFDEGTTLDAAITNALVVAVSGNYIDVEDSNSDQLATGDRTGSAQGNTMTFRSTGVNTVMGTPTYANTVDSSGNITQVVYTIPVAVTSFGGTLYLGQTAQLAVTATASNAFAYVFQNSSAPTTSDVGATATATVSTVAVGGDSAAVIEGTSYRLDDGLTKHFVIEVTLVTPSTAANSYRIALKMIRTFATSTWTTALNSDLTPVEQYQTAYKYITS